MSYWSYVLSAFFFLLSASSFCFLPSAFCLLVIGSSPQKTPPLKSDPGHPAYIPQNYANKFRFRFRRSRKMRRKFFMLLIVVTTMTAAGSAFAQQNSMMGQNPMVGGAAMFRTKDIVDNAVNSADHTTLVAAVKAAGLVETLKGAGPFTVFAPTNAAFEKLPAGTVDTLVKPENQATLTKILTYHVVAGQWDSDAISKAIKKGKGKARIKTVSGGWLTAWMSGNDLVVQDEKGGKSMVTIADVRQSNGVIHVVDTVLMPR
jgi:uncharacterized surface protein with fasciclin (FAS1) repeats